MKEFFIEHPNLPKGRVSLAMCGEYPLILSALHNIGIRTVSFRSDLLADEVARHQDMLMCHTGNDIIFSDRSQNISLLEKEGFTVFRESGLSAEYPGDVKLNVAIGSEFCIFNPNTISPSLKDFLIEKKLQITHTRQGYTKCSLCFVSENAVITEDTSIKKALENTGTDVLLISKGDIYLSEKHYGFFGGSTGKISEDTLAVTGELKYHRDADAITEFCNNHHVKIHELNKGRITDIGGILPLKEMR